jgi:hypothetical protein
MKKIAIALTLTVIAVFSTLTASFAYVALVNPSHQEATSSSTSPATPAPSSSLGTTHQEDNSSSTFPLNPTSPQPEPTPSTPDPTPTPVQTPSPNPTDIEVSVWNGVSDSNESLVVIDSPISNTEYSTNSVTLTVHAGAPSWSYMINLYLRADWLQNGKTLFYHMDYRGGPFFIAKGISVTTTLVDIPEGNHTITVTANPYTSIEGSSSVNFTVK